MHPVTKGFGQLLIAPRIVSMGKSAARWFDTLASVAGISPTVGIAIDIRDAHGEGKPRWRAGSPQLASRWKIPVL